MGEMPLGSCRPTVDRDANLVEALRRQEAGAAEALIAAYGDRAYRLAMRMTGNRSDAEEVVQDGFSIELPQTADIQNFASGVRGITRPRWTRVR